MLYKKYTVACVLLCVLSGALAQPAEKKRAWQFQSLNQIGLLRGETGTALQVQSVNGFLHKQFFAGLGVGIDGYRYITAPLFADVRFYLDATRNSLFLYEDGGTHFACQEPDKFPGATNYHFVPGFYNDAGMGYRIGVKRNSFFTISIGYTYKRTIEKQSTTICPFTGPCYQQEDKLSYDLSRLTVKMGWGF